MAVRPEIYTLIDSMDGTTRDERIQLAILNVLYDTKYPQTFSLEPQAFSVQEEVPAEPVVEPKKNTRAKKVK
ncbi:MAG: hypothetical protein ACRC2K_13340 [Clostridium sp.]